ncbi:MAG: hypothetical protein NTW28_29070, partial [Candidatus Solibacter sp.]|nr:hypothetical protein [Candidatus Solibacter sp.]
MRSTLVRLFLLAISTFFLHSIALGQQAEIGRQIYGKAADSVFMLIARSENGTPVAQGSGFLVAAGMIVSNHHVVDSASVVLDLGAIKVPAK